VGLIDKVASALNNGLLARLGIRAADLQIGQHDMSLSAEEPNLQPGLDGAGYPQRKKFKILIKDSSRKKAQ
jgi:hypothetical protein